MSLRRHLCLTLSLISFPLFACDINGTTGIVEKNDLYISVADKNVSSVTEQDFNDVITKAEEIYQPIVAQKGGTLKVNRLWQDGTVNASAQRTGNTWVVNMYGGLARHETITKDAFALVLCHELGHHLGGLPKKKMFFGTTWASNEGQADYFGNLKCMRKFVEGDNNALLMEKVEVPEFASQQCEKSFNNAEDVAICERTAMAGLSLGNLFRALKKLDVELKFETPDTNVVQATDDNHPAPQCRLDTYFAGALCDKDKSEDVSETDVNQGVCVRDQDEKLMTRPLCWYKEGSAGGDDGGFPFPFPFPRNADNLVLN